MPLQPGDTLERYVIEGLLGRGGMGAVYRAIDTRLHRRVALKVLLDEPGSRPGASTGGSARILREARAAAMLEHPNVVTTYDVGEISDGPHAGTAYLAMELLDGRSLRSFVGDPSVPMVVRIRWLTDVARGLQAAHERALVHRDVKPENVMIRTDGAVKVLDFGIAKHSRAPADLAGSALQLQTVTGEGLVIGTPLYMAPEQMRGGHVDAQADQFAWGVVAYELLTGVPPWGQKLDAISLVAAVLSDTPSDPRDRNPEIAPWLTFVVLRALAKSPDNRFPSMRELIGALEAGESGGSSALQVTDTSLGLTKSEPAAERGRKTEPARRQHALLAVVGLALALVGGALIRSRTHGALSAPVPSSDSAGSVHAQSGCASNAECTASLGKPALCRSSDGSCAAIASEDCRAVADDDALRSNDTLWLGSLYETTGSGAAHGKTCEEALELAQRDFAAARPALLSSGRPARPIGLVTCNSAADVRRAATHLVADLHVPAVIDAQNSIPLIDLVGSTLSPAQTLTVAPSAQSPLVTQIPRPAGSPPLVWRTANNASESIVALAKLVEAQFEPTLRAANIPRTRVAVVRQSNPMLLTLSEGVFSTIRFNGKSALDNGSDYKEIIVADHGTDDAAYAADIERLRAFAPNVVIGMGTIPFHHVIFPYERKVRPSGPGPYYVSTSGFESRVFAKIGKDAALRRRFFGVNTKATTAVNALLTMHLSEVFKHDVPRTAMLGPDYDAFYVLAYASYALGDRPPTGPNLADAIKHLVPPGPVVDVGPSGIFKAFTALSTGGSIDVNGAGGNLDFDLTSGEHETDLSIMCIGADADGVAHENVESGLVYIARTGELTGRLSCP